MLQSICWSKVTSVSAVHQRWPTFCDATRGSLVHTPKAGCLPKYEQCGLQVTLKQHIKGHKETQLYQDLEARKLQYRTLAVSIEALWQELTAYGEELERVEVSKYLGRLVASNDNDVQAMQSNLMKAWKCWSRIWRVLCAEYASPRICGIFYKATVQAILLFGSESWNLTLSALKCLEGFHIRVDRRTTGMMPKKEASMGTWIYLVLADVLKSAGLNSIANYAQVRR